MKLNDFHRKKSDPLLIKALEKAKPNEQLRIVAKLSSDGKSESAIEEFLAPASFTSRSEYRAHLIDKRKRAMAGNHNETRQSLKKLPLEIKGGKLSRIVVLEGGAQEILLSLELPGIAHASLDRQIDLR